MKEGIHKVQMGEDTISRIPKARVIKWKSFSSLP